MEGLGHTGAAGTSEPLMNALACFATDRERGPLIAKAHDCVLKEEKALLFHELNFAPGYEERRAEHPEQEQDRKTKAGFVYGDEKAAAVAYRKEPSTQRAGNEAKAFAFHWLLCSKVGGEARP